MNLGENVLSFPNMSTTILTMLFLHIPKRNVYRYRAKVESAKGPKAEVLYIDFGNVSARF